MATVEIHGMQQLLSNLQQLPDGLRRKVLRRALRQGAAMVRDEARRIVRRKSGALARGITVVSSRGNGQRGTVAFKVGLRRAVFYGRFLEFGHIARGPGQRLKGGERRRAAQRQAAIAGGQFVPPYPFMRPAAATKLEAALNHVASAVRSALQQGAWR